MKTEIKHLSKDEIITHYEMHSNPTGVEGSTVGDFVFLILGITSVVFVVFVTIFIIPCIK